MASPVSAMAKKSTITPDSALWSGDWTWCKRFFPVLYSSYWQTWEMQAAYKSSHKICLIQFWIYVNTWFQVSWGSPRKCVQHSGSEEFAQNGQPSVLLITASWDQTPYLLWTFLLPHLSKWLMDKSLRSHLSYRKPCFTWFILILPCFWWLQALCCWSSAPWGKLQACAYIKCHFQIITLAGCFWQLLLFSLWP